MSTLVIIGAAVLACAIYRKKHKSLDGVGRVKFYKALAEAQEQGIRFGDKNHELSDDEKYALSVVGRRNNYKQSRRSVESGRSYPEAFYRYLNNKYKQVAGIGAIVYPYQEYIVRNENGDAVVIFHDYDRETDLRKAIEEVENYAIDPELYGEMATLAYIADGGKFVWESKFVGGTPVVFGVKDELFGSGRTGKEIHPQEKKLRRKTLATEEKGGKYPAKFAEVLAAGGDSIAVRSGVLTAIREAPTPQDAQEILLGAYYNQFNQPEPTYEEVPY